MKKIVADGKGGREDSAMLCIISDRPKTLDAMSLW
jgi:hypothetical protein